MLTPVLAWLIVCAIMALLTAAAPRLGCIVVMLSFVLVTVVFATLLLPLALGERLLRRLA